MRWITLSLAIACAGAAAFALPPYANELMLPAGGVAENTAIPTATRGQYIAVTCARIEHVASEAIRVVMYLSPNEQPTGYKGVLATDQEITPGTIHVRVPDTPDLADHTVFVRVYYQDAAGRHSCDAGKVRIV